MAFNTTVPITIGQKGDNVCRPAGWMDIAEFFLFNYVAHSLTVLNKPGSRTLLSLNTSLTSILLPFSGAFRAFQVMAFYQWETPDPLNQARRAQALCTPIPSKYHPTTEVHAPPIHGVNVHGQHSVPPGGILEWAGLKKPVLKPDYQLSHVPWWFEVTPLKKPHDSSTVADASEPRSIWSDHNPISDINLSCNHNILKVSVAILQILHGVFQIYEARGTQLEQFGFAAYALTVIPYVLMSLVNLMASLCIPEYTAMYIVHYGGKKRPTGNASPPVSAAQNHRRTKQAPLLRVRPLDQNTLLVADEENPSDRVSNKIDPSVQVSAQNTTENSESDDSDQSADEWKDLARETVSGAVGVAWGNWDFTKRDKTLPQSRISVPVRLVVYFIGACVLATPYLTMKLLTNFRPGQSTPTQRFWIFAWLVMGQVGGLLLGLWENENQQILRRLPRLPKEITRSLISFLIIFFTSFGTIGGFITVAKMILQDQVCTVL